MNTQHQFKLKLDWSLDSKVPNNNSRRISRNHSIEIVGKPVLDVSAAKAFKGDSALYNPEDLLLASLTSCHMMSYLYCCSLHNIDVLSYTDCAEAILEVYNDGSGRIVKVVLNPVIIIVDENKIDTAFSLHMKANQLCFIANSCNFPVEHNPIIKVG